MHELSITQSIVDIVSEKAGDAKVQRVTLEIGKLSAIIPDAVRFCFEVCTKGTVAEGAALDIVEIPGQGRCRQCGQNINMDNLIAQCDCGSHDIECIAGEELLIKTMEVA